jgi:hypothetical protein
MAEGVENCCVLVCFLTPEYQESINCKKELTYAVQMNKPIIPCILGSQDKGTKWKPSGWLGFTITDMLYLNFSHIDSNNIDSKCQELIHKIHNTLGTTSLECPQQSNLADCQSDDNDYLELCSSSIIPSSMRQGPAMSDDMSSINLEKHSSEGDSVVRLLCEKSEIDCNQDLYATNGRFFNTFSISCFGFHNNSAQSISIRQLSASYENARDDVTQWIPCQIKTNRDNNSFNMDPNTLITCTISIKIELQGLPGVDSQHRCRAHPLLPQPLKMKIDIEDTQMKHASLIIEQVDITSF